MTSSNTRHCSSTMAFLIVPNLIKENTAWGSAIPERKEAAAWRNVSEKENNIGNWTLWNLHDKLKGFTQKLDRKWPTLKTRTKR